MRLLANYAPMSPSIVHSHEPEVRLLEVEVEEAGAVGDVLGEVTLGAMSNL